MNTVLIPGFDSVAVLYSRESDFGLSYMPFKNGNAYMEIVRQMHRAAFRNNMGVDFVLAENPDFTGYQILLGPPLNVASDRLLKKISEFVENGGHVIISVKSGFCNENNVVRYTKAPGHYEKQQDFITRNFQP